MDKKAQPDEEEGGGGGYYAACERAPWLCKREVKTTTDSNNALEKSGATNPVSRVETNQWMKGRSALGRTETRKIVGKKSRRSSNLLAWDDQPRPGRFGQHQAQTTALRLQTIIKQTAD